MCEWQFINVIYIVNVKSESRDTGISILNSRGHLEVHDYGFIPDVYYKVCDTRKV